MFFVCRNISIFALINGFLCIYAVLHTSGFIFAAFPPLLTRTSVRSILQQKACLPHLYGWYTQAAHSSQRSFLLHHSFESFLFDFRHVVEKLTYAISRDIPAQHPVRCLRVHDALLQHAACAARSLQAPGLAQRPVPPVQRALTFSGFFPHRRDRRPSPGRGSARWNTPWPRPRCTPRGCRRAPACRPQPARRGCPSGSRSDP